MGQRTGGLEGEREVGSAISGCTTVEVLAGREGWSGGEDRHDQVSHCQKSPVENSTTGAEVEKSHPIGLPGNPNSRTRDNHSLQKS